MRALCSFKSIHWAPLRTQYACYATKAAPAPEKPATEAPGKPASPPAPGKPAVPPTSPTPGKPAVPTPKVPNTTSTTKATPPPKIANPVVIFEDKNYIFIKKERGIPIMGVQPNLHQKMRELYGTTTYQPAVLHTFDKLAGGIMVFGKHKDAEKHFYAQQEAGKVHNGLLVGAYGTLQFSHHGKVTSTIMRVPNDMSRFSIVRYGGKTFEMDYYAVSQFPLKASPSIPLKKSKAKEKGEEKQCAYLLAVNNITNHEHQTRAVCASLSAPVVGDAVYGGLPNSGVLLFHSVFLRFPQLGKKEEYDVWDLPTDWTAEFQAKVNKKEFEETWKKFGSKLPEIAPWKKAKTGAATSSKKKGEDEDEEEDFEEEEEE
eukprot:TRINITY_DN2898_c0_g1_i1.p1 TRINITY_DN2898_c0_g1~~TRINITY_DN2898_c0_g1_i1.p1  ORF type:complete len:372 (-),score=96.20 TRINITY_DN2898_c0_g1_i1:7-1122(-)